MPSTLAIPCSGAPKGAGDCDGDCHGDGIPNRDGTGPHGPNRQVGMIGAAAEHEWCRRPTLSHATE